MDELDDAAVRNLGFVVRRTPATGYAELSLIDLKERTYHTGLYVSVGKNPDAPLLQALAIIQKKLDLLEADVRQKQERVSQLERIAFGVRSEKTPTAADAGPEETDDGEVPAKNVVPISKPRRARRKSLPESLPRDEVVHELPVDDRHCRECGGALHAIGGWAETSEQLVVVREHVRVRRHRQQKYGCRCCGAAPVTAPKPPTMLPGSSYDSPEFLAYLVTRKFQYSLPFYRLEQFFEQAGCPVSRTTMARLLNEVVERRLTALYEHLKDELRQAPVLHADETTIQVLKETGRNAQSKSYLWAYSTTVGAKRPVVLFDYQMTRSGSHPKRFLTDGEGPFKGILVCDGYKGYTALEDVRLAGCWAHARRRFEAILKDLDPEARTKSKAQEAFGLISTLYAIERRIRDDNDPSRYAARRRESSPIVEQLKEWLLAHRPLVPPECALGKAISYTLNEWNKLVVYLDDARVPIDNNEDERQIRHFAVGRKNWLFADSMAGGYTNAVLYSLVRTAIANRLDPYAYLMRVFSELPAMTTSDEVRRLLPWYIQLESVEGAKIAA